MKSPPKKIRKSSGKKTADRGAASSGIPRRPRQAATPFALATRIRELELKKIVDTRQQPWVLHPVSVVVGAMILGLAVGETALRGVERMTAMVGAAVRCLLGVVQRISDTTQHDLLMLLTPADVAPLLSSQVKAEWNRGNLRPDGLGISVAAFDGKQVIKYTEKQLVTLYCKAHGLASPPELFSRENLKAWIAVKYPHIQCVQQKQGRKSVFYGLVRSLRMTLASAAAAPTLADEFIPGNQNEVGFAPEFLKNSLKPYLRTSIVQLLTADAGNCSSDVASTIVDLGLHYLLAVKGNQPATQEEALRLLGNPSRPADWQGPVEIERGMRIQRNAWVADASCVSDHFASAGQFVRSQRLVTNPKTGETTETNRYFITSMSASSLTAKQAATIVRYHWRCENNGHWTSDSIFREDKGGRTPFTRDPDKLQVATVLRLVAQNLTAFLRALSRKPDPQGTLPSWDEVIANIRRAMEGLVRHRDRAAATI